MHFHLPKPLHGWRALAGEVGIIVLGVLIALGAEEVARSIVNRREAAGLRQSMKHELAVDRARWEANHHDFPCTLKLLDNIRGWAARPSSGAPNHLDLPLLWTMHDSAWQIARSSPAMTAMPLEDRDELADAYFVIEVQQGVLFKTEEALNRVEALAETADRPSSLDALPEAAAEARASIRLMDKNFALLEQEFDGLGIRSDMSALGPNPFNFEDRCPATAQAEPTKT